MPEPSILSAITQLIDRSTPQPKGLAPALQAELDQAVRTGDVAGFLARHPELTRQEISAVLSAIAKIPTAAATNPGIQASPTEGGAPTTGAAAAGTGLDVINALKGLLGGGDGGPIGAMLAENRTGDWRDAVQGSGSPTSSPATAEGVTPIGADAAASARQAVLDEAKKRGFVVSENAQDASKLVEQQILSLDPSTISDPTLQQLITQAQADGKVPPQVLQIFMSQLAQYNPELRANSALPANYVLQGPSSSRTYTAKAGDTARGIATSLGVSYEDLLRENPQLSQGEVTPGMPIVIPVTAVKARPTEVSGRPAEYLPGQTAGGEQTQPIPTPTDKPDSTNPYQPSATPNIPGGQGDLLLQSLWNQGLLGEHLIGSKNYTAGYGSVLESQLAQLDQLARLKNIMDPSYSLNGSVMSDLFDQYTKSGMPIDPNALISEALTDPEYRGLEQTSPDIAFRVLAAARMNNMPSEALAQLYTGGYADKLQYQYQTKYAGQQNAPTLLEYLISIGL